ncbi:GLUG motif-containing protein [Oceanobacillus halotolerans]|uniref:GLUG motif-containing protein n=1 Tax=Oceanobacillus halotolerans TaxID=2663380 RepID=UPI0013DB502A|nr:GLUG motif-containing protein [Oceanobacillus halotolerans]
METWILESKTRWIKTFILLFSVMAVFGALIFLGANTSQAEEDIVYISTAEDLDKIRLDMKGHYVLTNDIDLNVAPYNTGSGWEQIGDGDDQGRFEGTFDGAGHTIKGLMIDRSNSSAPHGDGLFGIINNGATIKNVTLEDVNINSRNHTGALVGVADSGTLIENVQVTGNINGGGASTGGVVGSLSNATIKDSEATVTLNGVTSVGGLVGQAGGSNATVNNSTSAGSITGRDNVGGLVGKLGGNVWDSSSSASVSSTRTNDDIANAGGLVGNFNTFDGEIKNSSATGHVEAFVDNVGGLIGYTTVNTSASITDSYATGDVSGRHKVGGLIGYHTKVLVSDSYAKGNVDGEDHVGGFIGLMEEEFTTVDKSFAEGNVNAKGANVGGFIGKMTSDTTIQDAYAKGDVNGAENTGGFVGANEVATIDRAYASGAVSSSGQNQGGFVGNDYRGDYDSNYYDEETTGFSDNQAAIPKSTEEMYTRVTFENWNFTTTWKNVEGDYPLLREEPFTLITDVDPNYWGRDHITEAVERDVVDGAPDPNNDGKFLFKPRKDISRAEMVIILVNALGVNLDVDTTTFNDNDDIPHWAIQHVAKAQELGIVEGDQDGNFNPGQLISRAGIATMVQRAYNLDATSSGDIGFEDEDDIPSWAKESVTAVYDYGLMEGQGSNKFAPKATAKRVEAAVTVLRALDIK